MRNVNMRVDGAILTIQVKLDENGESSASGKSSVVASTHGPVSVPGTDLLVNLNLYRRIGRGDRQ